MSLLDDILSLVDDLSSISIGTQEKIISTIIAISLMVFLRNILLGRIDRFGISDEAIFVWRRVTYYLLMIFVLIIITTFWIEGLSGIGTFLGLAIAGIAVALNQPLQSIGGWMYILMRRPFIVGDRIKIQENFGDVIDIRLFSSVLYELEMTPSGEQSTGRIIHVPNRYFLEFSFTNFSRGLGMIWLEIPIVVTFESNWKKAKQIIETILSKESLKYMEKAKAKSKIAVRESAIKPGSLTPKIFVLTSESGIQICARYLTDIEDRRSSENRFWMEILEAFGKENDLDFAYPTRRTYVNYIEGKSEARATNFQDI